MGASGEAKTQTHVPPATLPGSIGAAPSGASNLFLNTRWTSKLKKMTVNLTQIKRSEIKQQVNNHHSEDNC